MAERKINFSVCRYYSCPNLTQGLRRNSRTYSVFGNGELNKKDYPLVCNISKDNSVPIDCVYCFEQLNVNGEIEFKLYSGSVIVFTDTHHRKPNINYVVEKIEGDNIICHKEGSPNKKRKLSLLNVIKFPEVYHIK